MGNQNKPAVDMESAFRQLARRMEQIRREYGSAEAYQEAWRLEQTKKVQPPSKESNTPEQKKGVLYPFSIR